MERGATAWSEGTTPYDEAVSQGVPYADLPVGVQRTVAAKDYDAALLAYSLLHQWSYEKCDQRWHIRQSLQDKAYYTKMLQLCRERRMVYPYKFIDRVLAHTKVAPFTHYRNILKDMLKAEVSYDTLPNFSANDCLRLTGIGRNQYINIMNEKKANKKPLLGKLVAAAAGASAPSPLPSQIVPEATVEPWWALVAQGDRCEKAVRDKEVTAEEAAFASTFLPPNDAEGGGSGGQAAASKRLACAYDRAAVHALFHKGLVHPSIKIADGDCVVVPPLTNFVMNRTSADPLEKLLYDILVAIDSRTTIGELSIMLKAEADDIKNAVTICCLLGMAHKTSTPQALRQQAAARALHSSWTEQVEDKRYLGAGGVAAAAASASNNSPASGRPDWFSSPGRGGSEEASPPPLGFLDGLEQSNLPNDSIDGAEAGEAEAVPAAAAAAAATAAADDDAGEEEPAARRIGFVFDSELTAYLMMGNLNILKEHAVTLFEAGKMTDEMLEKMAEQLETLEPRASEREGEVAKYFNHALSLREVLRHLRSNKAALKLPGCDGKLDLLRAESLNSLNPDARVRVVKKNYACLFTMSPLACPLSVSTLDGYYGNPSALMASPWFPLFTAVTLGFGSEAFVLPRGACLKSLPGALAASKTQTMLLYPWVLDSHPTVLHASNALLRINEELVWQPVMLVPHDVHGSVTEVVHAPFPCPGGGGGSGGEESAAEASVARRQEKVADLVRRMTQVFSLEASVGHIRMVVRRKKAAAPSRTDVTAEQRRSEFAALSDTLRLERASCAADAAEAAPAAAAVRPLQQTASDATSAPGHGADAAGGGGGAAEGCGEEAEEEVTPQALFFGLPMFDPKLTHDAISTMTEQGLLTGERMGHHNSAMRKLVSLFVAFVQEHVAAGSTVDAAAEGLGEKYDCAQTKTTYHHPHTPTHTHRGVMCTKVLSPVPFPSCSLHFNGKSLVKISAGELRRSR